MGKHNLEVQGYCDPAFKAVKETFQENFDSRNEIGAGVCVYKENQKVVDLWGGHRDEERIQTWTEDTITLMNSVAKSICALAVHILVDRGLVNLDAPVATYWPEFGQANVVFSP
jgi:CubicO group peptidase (beta-lactamase class C family)